MTITRRKAHAVKIGDVTIGDHHPIVVQSMTNTDTADIEASVEQITQLAHAGSQLVRLTVDRDEAAAAIPHIRDRLAALGLEVPLIGDFHYIGHKLLTDHPACAQALAKYRINPGNVGFGAKRDTQFATMIEIALKYDKPVRIGGNWGSLDQALLTRMMDDNAKAKIPKTTGEITRQALIQSVLLSAARAEELGLGREKIVLSAKVSQAPDLIAVYSELAGKCEYALHLGLTEAGLGSQAIVSSSAGLGVLLNQGIGDTIRISLTPEPGGAREKEVEVAQQLLQAMGLRSFSPSITACPGCGRTTSTLFQELAIDVETYVQTRLPQWREQYQGFEDLRLAVMGCIVNGPGESKHADIGISLPGTGEAPSAPVFIDGKKAKTLRGDDLAGQFCALVEDYVAKRYDAK